MSTDPEAVSPANETPEAEMIAAMVDANLIDWPNRPAPVQPPATNPDEQTGWHRHQTQGVVRDSDCRCSHGIRNVPAPDPAEWCVACQSRLGGPCEAHAAPAPAPDLATMPHVDVDAHSLMLPDPDETCEACEGSGRGPQGMDCVDCTPVPPATTGGADEAEGLARLMLSALRDAWRDEYSPQTVADKLTGAVLASDWLRERDLARDAAVARAASEKAWDEALLRARDDVYSQSGIQWGRDDWREWLRIRAVEGNPYRASDERGK